MKQKFQVYVVKILIWIAQMLFKCFVSYAIYKTKKNEKGEINMANPFWSAMGQIALATAASYGSAKLANSQTEWKPFRDQLLQQLTTAALSVAVAQVNHVANEKTKGVAEAAITSAATKDAQPLVNEATKLATDAITKEANKLLSKAVQK